MTPAVALTWELAARHRWTTVTAAVFLLAAPWLPLIAAAYAMGAGAMLLVSLAGHGFERPLGVRCGQFPRRLFVLPVTTWGLILPPMLLTTLPLLVVTGLLVVAGRPMWPGMLAVAGTAWLQVLAWSPMPNTFVRAMLLAALILAAAALGALEEHIAPGPTAAALTVVAALAYPAARVGVGLGRRGVGFSDPPPEALAAPCRPFPSAGEAQAWFEWRRLWFNLFAMSWILIVAVPTTAMTAIGLRRPLVLQLANFGPVVEALGPGLVAAAAGLMTVLWPSFFGAGDIGRVGGPLRHEMTAFEGGKPVPDGFFLAAKYRLMTQFALFTWAVGWVLVLGTLAVAGEIPGILERVEWWFGSKWVIVALLPGLMAGLFVLSWLWMARGLWMGLSRWPVVAMGAVACALIFPTGVIVGRPWAAALGLAAEAVALAFGAWGSRWRGAVAAVVVVCLAATLAGWWPVALLLWPAAGMMLPGTALNENRHR